MLPKEMTIPVLFPCSSVDALVNAIYLSCLPSGEASSTRAGFVWRSLSNPQCLEQDMARSRDSIYNLFNE